MYTVRLLLNAEIETAEACKWYEKRCPGLGGQFLKEFDRYISLIAKNPFHFAVNFSETLSLCRIDIIPLVYSLSGG